MSMRHLIIRPLKLQVKSWISLISFVKKYHLYLSYSKKLKTFGSMIVSGMQARQLPWLSFGMYVQNEFEIYLNSFTVPVHNHHVPTQRFFNGLTLIKIVIPMTVECNRILYYWVPTTIVPLSKKDTHADVWLLLLSAQKWSACQGLPAIARLFIVCFSNILNINQQKLVKYGKFKLKLRCLLLFFKYKQSCR